MHIYIVASSFLEQHLEGARLQRIFFQICYEYKFRRLKSLNNIFIIGNPRDTDQTNLIYCVNSHYRIGLIMRCYLFLSTCKMAWVWAKFNPVTVTP